LPLACIPLLPATDLPVIEMPVIDTPAIEMPAADELAEVAERGGEASFALPTPEYPGSGDAALCLEESCQEEVHSDARRREICLDESDPSDVPEWNSLDAGPEPNWLFATLEESPGRFVESGFGHPLSSSGAERNPADGLRDDSASSERRQPGDLPAVTDLGAAWRGAEHERREWTGAVTVRYPLAEGVRPGQGSTDGFPAQGGVSSAGFLDVGRIATPTTGRLAFRSASLVRTEIPSSSTAAASLATEFEADGLAQAPGAPKPPVAAARHRPSLTGENRSQRMVLLASAASRFRTREAAVMVPSPNLPSETSSTPATDGRSGEGGDEAGSSAPRRDALGLLHRPSWRDAPPADDPVSRSTMEGIAAFFFFAVGWFRRRQPASCAGGPVLEGSLGPESRKPFSPMTPCG
jgi:hypothetical protein